MRYRNLILVVVGLSAVAAATEPSVMSLPAAKGRHEAALKSARETFNKAQLAADQEYIDTLTTAENAAMQQGISGKNDADALDTARVQAVQQMKEHKIAQVLDVSPDGEIDALRTVMSGTRWQWDDSTIKFLSNGNIEEPNWTSRGLITAWKPVDRRTIVLAIVSGRTTNRYAILHFSESLDQYSGYDFEGQMLHNFKKVQQ